MSHWAEIDSNNKVIRIVVGDNNDPNGDEGLQWITNNLGGTWLKTSYNNKIRKNFAGVNFTYDKDRDAFIAPRPNNAISFNDDTCQWIVPIEDINAN